MPRTFVSPNGFTVLVGKNHVENDNITFNWAHAHDFWFHAQNVPGAHVLMQWDPHSSSTPSLVDFQFAADIAAFFSKSRNNPKVAVYVARGCDVERPKRPRLGQVLCSSSKVLSASPSRFRDYDRRINTS